MAFKLTRMNRLIWLNETNGEKKEALFKGRRTPVICSHKDKWRHELNLITNKLNRMHPHGNKRFHKWPVKYLYVHTVRLWAKACPVWFTNHSKDKSAQFAAVSQQWRWNEHILPTVTLISQQKHFREVIRSNRNKRRDKKASVQSLSLRRWETRRQR